MDPLEPNPWKDFKMEGITSKLRSFLSTVIPHLFVLIILWIASLGVGYILLMYGLKSFPRGALDDQTFKELMIGTTSLSLVVGFVLWGIMVWEERRTRR